MGSLREAARDRDWQGGLGLAHCRLGSVEFVVMIYRNQPPRYPDLAALPARKARRHGRSRRREFRVMNYRTARAPLREEPPPVSYGVSARGRPRSGLAGGAWSRSLQARLGRVCSYDLSKSAAALP